MILCDLRFLILNAGLAESCLPVFLTEILTIIASINLQHLEIMAWCIRHQFLENVRFRFSDFASWSSSVRERKSAAIYRAWPDSVAGILGSGEQSTSSLFIEDALSNLETDDGYGHQDEGELAISSFLASVGNSVFLSKLQGLAGCYPFESLRVAVDLLFLQGNSSLVVAKQAIVSY